MTTSKMLRPSAADSARFGMAIARAHLEDTSQALEGFLAELLDTTHDLVILRIPAGSHDFVNGLRDRNVEATHADTLVYYRRGLDDEPPLQQRAGRSDACLATAVEGDVDAIADIASGSFVDYRSHYHAAREFASDKVSAGYVEWATSFIRTPPHGGLTYVVRCKDEIAGFFSCVRTGHRGTTLEIVLNAVKPSHQRAGVYRTGLLMVMAEARRAGMADLLISTQVWNYRVQKAWAACGLHLCSAYDTYHLRASSSAAIPGRATDDPAPFPA